MNPAPRDELEPEQWESLARAFREQLLACLQKCSRGRKGLFGDVELLGGDQGELAWPEAARLRELALAMQGIAAQSGEPSALPGEFLDLCTMHGESHPGEPRLARAFLSRIEKGEVATQPEGERKPW